MKKKEVVSKQNARLISFKVSPEIYRELEKYSSSQTNEVGLPLSPSLAARRLLLGILKKVKK